MSEATATKMQPRGKKILVLLGLAACLSAILLVRSQPVVNWFMARQLLTEADANKRIVLINTSLAYDPQFWNSRYLRSALLAKSKYEREFIADLLFDRLGTNAVDGLRELAQNEKSASAQSNALAVVSLIEAFEK